MIVVDASAVVAILTGETDAGDLLGRLAIASKRCMSAANLLETRVALEIGRDAETSRLADFLTRWDIEIVPLDVPLVEGAVTAYRRFGKGRHAARLNMGDCAAYALAKARGWPLLFKGEDFSQTDIERA